MKTATKCIQVGYEPKNGEPRVLPICQSTTYAYDNGDELASLFDLTKDGHMYTRISNPTVAAVEKKIAALEGGVGALCTSSGQAATLLAILNITQEGDNFLAFDNLYGGTTNLFTVTLKKLGIEVRYIDQEMSDEEIVSFIDSSTRLIFGETLANPSLQVCDLSRFSSLAHAHGLPFIVDNTFTTPIICRPFEYGVDIVVHSTSKYMDGHAMVVGGVIVDGGTFDWSTFPGLSTPDESYHGVIYTKVFKECAYITKARVQLMRDFGVTPQPTTAFLLNLGLETLDLRVRKHSENALTIAKHLVNHPKIAWLNYPGLKEDKYHNLAMKYFDDGLCSGVIGLGIKGGRQGAMDFMNHLKMAKIVVHVADARTSVLHPASTTHRQLSEEALLAAGVKPEFVRFSVGIEDVTDIIEDIEQALEAVDAN